MNEIIIDMISREKRFAVKQNGIPNRFYIEQPDDRSEVGNIYLGIVETVNKSVNAAFVNIGKGKNGYLQRDNIPAFIQSDHPQKSEMSISHFIHEGEKIVVQVKKDEIGTKGTLLTAIIEIAGVKTVYMPQGKYVAISKQANSQQRNKWLEIAHRNKTSKEGFIVRTEALSGTEADWLKEVEQLREQSIAMEKIRNQVKAPARLVEKTMIVEEIMRECARLRSGVIISNERPIIDQLQKQVIENWAFHIETDKENIFSKHQLDKELDLAKRNKLWLPNGAYIVIDEAEAATIIDVNTGKFTKRQNIQDTILQTNIAAAKEIAKQIKLRDYGGIILIDFIDMKSSIARKKVQQTLEQECQTDNKPIHFFGFTSLGIFELTRKRTRQSLSETIFDECKVCSGTGKVISAESTAFHLERELFGLSTEHEAILIECDAKTKLAFAGLNNQHLLKLEKLFHLKIYFHIIESAVHTYEIRRLGTVKEMENFIDRQ